MKFIFTFLTSILLNINVLAQFSTESQVVTYMSAKEFYNSSYDMKVSYEFLPTMNTYGIKCVNGSNEKFYYINCTVRPYGSSADINGTDPYNGKTFGFRVYNGRISVQGVDFNLKGKTNQVNNASNINVNEEDIVFTGIMGNMGNSSSAPPKPISTDQIKKFQDWMDLNHLGWVNGKNLNKGTGYGSWGPSTQKAWDQYGKEYK
jgi:hypothetical protein